MILPLGLKLVMMPSTIFALSTPLGKSGLCIFRLTGPNALKISNILCGKDLSRKPRFMQRVSIKHQNQIIDSGLACYFVGPNSATGEDVVEFNLHGSLAVIDSMKTALKNFSSFNIREAERGEFSKRALLNGKMSLTEVEGLSDLLESETLLQLRIFQQNTNGKLDRHIVYWQESILNILVELEAKIEFEETENLTQSNDLINNLFNLTKDVKDAINNSNLYERVKNGFQVLFFGPPNTGKSSLMNYLARKNVSIVTEKEGTTRDLIHYDAQLNGVPIRFIDSAGIRTTDCQIEALGVELAKQAAESADVIVILVCPHNLDFLAANLRMIDIEKTIIVFSKSDLISDRHITDFNHKDIIHVSSVTGEGIELLKARITDIALKKNNISSLTAKILLNDRQQSCLKECLEHLQIASEKDDILIKVEHLKSSLKALKKIRGEYYNIEEIYNRVFANFCIGK